MEVQSVSGAIQKGSSRGEAEGQEDGGAEIQAAGRNIPLPGARLAAADPHRQKALRVEHIRSALDLSDHGIQSTANCRGRESLGQTMLKRHLGEVLKSPIAVGDGPADDGIGSIGCDQALFDGRVAGRRRRIRSRIFCQSWKRPPTASRMSTSMGWMTKLL